MNIENLNMSFGTEEIFNDVSIHLDKYDMVGITGVNGAGKSTLFNIILKKIEPESGKISLPNNTHVGYLPQVIVDDQSIKKKNVFLYLLEARPIKKYRDEIEKLYIKASNETDDKNLAIIMNKINKLNDKLAYYDEYEAESILLKLIDGMKIPLEILDQTMETLSGGQKSKIAFLRLLYQKPEILLLDEPTNHLDLDTKNFIIDYLKSYRGLVLVISHDISFLDAVTKSTLYIDKLTHKAIYSPFSYSKYLKIKKENDAFLEKKKDMQDKERARLQRVVDKYLHGNEKKANIAKDRLKKIEKLDKDKVVLEKTYKKTNFKIKVTTKSGIMPLKVTDLKFGYRSDKLLYDNLKFSLNRGEKFLIVGENGIGKSTLLKLIVGLLKPLSGEIVLGHNVKIGYYAQEHEILDLDKSIINNFSDSGLEEKELRALLGNFLFHGDDVFKKVKVLSPGERSRVALAKIAAMDTNFLVLDEPTNHLDPDTEKIIASTFKNYEGTILLVSHNNSFIEELNVERMLMLPSGAIRYYDKDIVKKYHNLNNKENHEFR